jgi:hypothetical protein
MKRIGDDQFAVEFNLNPPTGDREIDDRLYGRMCFIVGGVPIGNAEDDVSLNIGAVEMARLGANRGRRSNPTLMQKSAEDLFRTVFCALTEDKGQTDAQVAEDWATYSPFLGIARFEPFDDWDAFLVEDADHARYIWRHRSESASQVHEQALRPGQFDDVVEAFVNEVRRIAPGIVK